MNLERVYNTGVSAHQRGQGSAWVAALAAAEIVGKYAKGETANYASDCRVSKSTVQEWAQGYLLYSWMRAELPHVRELRNVRQGLTLSHFTKMAALWHRYELGIWEVWAQLETAWAEQISVRSMVTNCERQLKGEDGDSEPEPLSWSRRALPFLDRLANTDLDNDRRVKRAARLLQGRIKQAWGLE